MKYILYVLVVTALVAAAAPAAEPTAWSKTSWGMTVPQLRQILPDAIDGAGSEKIRIGEQFEAPALIVPEIEAAGMRFRVLLHLGPNGLDQVNLQPLERATISEAAFHRLELALGEKFGRPFSRSGEGAITSQWKTPTALIRLQYSQTRQIGLSSLWLIYTPLPKSESL